jgi:Protein of unknown function (DUF3575)
MRLSHKLLAVLAGVAALTVTGVAAAQSPSEQPPSSTEATPSGEYNATPSGPVNVALPDQPPLRRYAAIEWNPLPLLVMNTGTKPDPNGPKQGGLGKLSLNIVLAPLEHHALILSPFYALTRTTPVTVYDDELNPTQLPVQTFRGYGTELGYRYYAGRGGLRGFFAGPSLIISSFTATAQNGDKTHYLDYGIAGDIGYQALVVDRVSLSLGLGLQYTTTNKAIPEQMLWAKVFANTAVLPRALISVGYAL